MAPCPATQQAKDQSSKSTTTRDAYDRSSRSSGLGTHPIIVRTPNRDDPVNG
jgi:hypothetical protein